MSNFKILEVTKENKNEYLDAIAALEEKVLQDMENKGKIGQLFITGKEDIEQYVESEDNSVIIAINAERRIREAAYITQNQKAFTYNDIKKYLADFNIIKIDERETIRFKHKKNYIVFIAKKII